jgi:hypothetical protein
MPKILLRSAKDPWSVRGPKRTLAINILGTNSGNLLFSTAVHRTLMTDDVDVVSNRWNVRPEFADEVNEEYDAFVVPLANAFRLSWVDYLERLTAFIEKLTIPVVVVGVGAQTAIDGDPSRLAKIAPQVKAFVGAVLDRSSTFGVRGEFTADYVRSLGFSDVEVIGCPSMYLWGPELTVDRALPGLDASSALSLTVSPYVKALGPIVMHHHAAYPDLTYIAQDNETLRTMLYGEPDGEPAAAPSDVPVHLSHPMFVEDKVLFFVDPWPWIDYLRGRDFSFGSRLHGSIAAILAGTPAYLLAHDSRTLELARYHQLPHQLMKDVPPTIDARDLYDAADVATTRAGHPERFQRFLAFLERNGLSHAYQPGASSDRFDQRVAEQKFPPAVRVRRPRSRTGGQARPQPGWRTQPADLAVVQSWQRLKGRIGAGRRAVRKSPPAS